MSNALTQKDFDSMGCQRIDCDHKAHKGPKLLHARCHPDEGTRCSYEDGVIEVCCRACNRLVARVAVDPGDVTRH